MENMAEAKVALVTGSSSGIGAATARLLSSKGYKVTVVGSTKEKVEQVARECAELSPQKFQPLTLVLDNSDPNNGQVAVRKTVDHFGRLDELVDNTGKNRRNRLSLADTEGLYNSELPSPKPSVLLPNFSISSYTASRKLSWNQYE